MSGHLPSEPDEKAFCRGKRQRLEWALSVSSPGDVVAICRTEGRWCNVELQDVCSLCKRVTIQASTTVDELMELKLDN